MSDGRGLVYKGNDYDIQVEPRDSQIGFYFGFATDDELCILYIDEEHGIMAEMASYDVAEEVVIKGDGEIIMGQPANVIKPKGLDTIESDWYFTAYSKETKHYLSKTTILAVELCADDLLLNYTGTKELEVRFSGFMQLKDIAEKMDGVQRMPIVAIDVDKGKIDYLLSADEEFTKSMAMNKEFVEKNMEMKLVSDAGTNADGTFFIVIAEAHRGGEE